MVADDAEYHRIFHIKNSVTVGGDDVENEVTLFCWQFMGDCKMKLIIEIPKEFEEHYNNDNFEDSLKRIETDMKFGEKCLSGLYEEELIEMLRNAFYNAVEVK